MAANINLKNDYSQTSDEVAKTELSKFSKWQSRSSNKLPSFDTITSSPEGGSSSSRESSPTRGSPPPLKRFLSLFQKSKLPEWDNLLTDDFSGEELIKKIKECHGRIKTNKTNDNFIQFYLFLIEHFRELPICHIDFEDNGELFVKVLSDSLDSQEICQFFLFYYSCVGTDTDLSTTLVKLFKTYLDGHFNSYIFENEYLLTKFQENADLIGAEVVDKWYLYLKLRDGEFEKYINILIKIGIKNSDFPTLFRGNSLFTKLITVSGKDVFLPFMGKIEENLQQMFESINLEECCIDFMLDATTLETNRGAFLSEVTRFMEMIFSIDFEENEITHLKRLNNLIKNNNVLDKNNKHLLGSFFFLRIINPHLINLKFDDNEEKRKMTLRVSKILQTIANQMEFSEGTDLEYLNKHRKELSDLYEKFRQKFNSLMDKCSEK